MIRYNFKKDLVKKNNTKIVFCSSYLSIPITINLIEEFQNSLVIVTQSKNICNFLHQYYPKIKIILIDTEKKILEKNPLKIIQNIYFNYLLKNKIKSFLNHYIGCDVYTFITAYSPLIGYCLKILSYNNNIFHNKIIKIILRYKRPPLKLLLYSIYLRLMYGINFDILVGKDNIYKLVYSKKFFKKIKAKKKTININKHLLKKFVSKNFLENNKKILLLSSKSAFIDNAIDKKLFYIWIKKWISSNNSKKILLKRKDNKEKKIKEENLLDDAPVSCPANLLIYSHKIVVGYHSATLFEAANVGCIAISMLDYLGNKKNNSNFKSFLIQNLKKNKKIFFPKNQNQFYKIINEL